MDKKEKEKKEEYLKIQNQLLESWDNKLKEKRKLQKKRKLNENRKSASVSKINSSKNEK